MAQQFVELSSTSSTDRVGGSNAIYDGVSVVHLSDGTCAFIECDGTNWLLKHSGSDHATVSTIATLATASFALTNSVLLVRDSLDNLYCIGNALTGNLRCQAFTKGGGYSWSAQTVLTAASNAFNRGDATWCNTGGGTNSKGHILVVGQASGGTASIYWILDAGAALAGSGTLVTNTATAVTFLSNGSTVASPTRWSLSNDGFGATSGISAVSNEQVGSWAVNSSGALSTNTAIGACPFTAVDTGILRCIRYASNAWAIVGTNPSSLTHYGVARYSSSAQLTGLTDSGTPTNMPLNGTAKGYDAFRDPNTANKIWIIALGTLAGTNLPVWRLGVTVSGSPSFDSAATADDTLSNVNTKQGSLRCVKEPIGATVDWQSFQKISGTNWALDGDYTQFAQNYTATYTGAMTPAGTIAKQAQKKYAGAMTPAGSLVRSALKRFTGAITPTGALAKRANKVYAGAFTPSGALGKQPNKALAGTASSSGSIRRLAGKGLGGVFTPAGNPSKAVSSSLSGSVAPAGSLTSGLLRSLSIAGSIASSGAISRLAGKLLGGGATPGGSIVKDVSLSAGGDLSPSGDLDSVVGKFLLLAGSIIPSGSLTRLVAKLTGGDATPVGSLTRDAQKALEGSVTPAGGIQIIGTLQLVLGGAITTAGNLAKQAQKQLAGSLPSSGGLVRFVSKLLAGALTPSGLFRSRRPSRPRTISGREQQTSLSGREARTTQADRTGTSPLTATEPATILSGEEPGL